jgi:hypothetical protein
MIRKTLIALTAASAIALSFGASSAKADSIDFGFGFGTGGPGFGGVHIHAGDSGYYGPGYYDAGYDDGSDCHYVMKHKLVWNAWHTYKVWSWKKALVCY